MSPAAPIEGTAVGTWSTSKVVSSPEGSDSVSRRFADLRGVRWRIDLGILPSLSSSSIDHLRRVTADSRRRYAGLRRRLLVNPHIPRDGPNSPSLVMDNPLSQNPDSMWGRFFRSAELERMVDQDLSRLYPEHGTYFQTPGCQSMLRRILLLWCLRHPEHGYRQGMHELLAPLLYVLHADVEHLSQVRKLYDDHFIDKFDGFTFHENDLTYNFDFKKFTGPIEDGNGSQKCPPKISNLDELDPRIQDIILVSDAYGAEGELGIVLSEKFMEHDAYCMFDALMNGTGGAVAMAEFFSPSPTTGSHTGLPPVIEASSALYHLLSIVDTSLHGHLVELGVEPQYFALRWLRVLFGREFLLEDLLLIWDEIFACDNSKLPKFADDTASSVGVFNSHRGAFISAFAVSMILYVRSSLLATENATSCLQRLLNFPADINLDKLIVKAKTLKVLSLDANNSMLLPTHYGAFDQSKPLLGRGQSLSSGSVSPRTPLSLVPESYWEEKWRDLLKAEELKQSSPQKVVPNRKSSWSEKVRLSLSRTESAPSPSKVYRRESEPKVSVRRNLLEDLSRQLGLEEDSEKVGGSEDLGLKEPTSEKVEVHLQDGTDKNSCPAEERCLSGNAASEENSSIYSDSQSANDHEHQSERSSAASNASLDENDDDSYNVDPSRTHGEDSSLIVSDSTEDSASKSESITDCAGKTIATLDFPADKSLKSGQDEETVGKPVTVMKERKILFGKFQWLWNFGRSSGEGTPERVPSDATKAPNGEYDQNGTATTLSVNESSNSSLSGEHDQSSNSSLRNLGHSMLENIQVIESVIQQERGQVGALENFSRNILVGKGQVTAMAALMELRKISNLLSEM